jgi:predicted ATPase
LARHCTEAGLTEKAAVLWGKAGLRSLDRSALVEAIEQLMRALDQIDTLPSTPARRREQIKYQVRLITPLMHVKGHASRETRAAVERARLLIEQAETLGEPLDDPLSVFSVLYGLCIANLVAFDGDVLRELAAHVLKLAEQQGATIPLLLGHRIMGTLLLYTGELAKARTHCDRGIALYDPAQHRRLATRFGQDAEVSMLSYRSWALWLLGYPHAALADADHALRCAREVGDAATMMFALATAPFVHFCCGNHAAASASFNELISLAEEKGAPIWKVGGRLWLQQIQMETTGTSGAVQELIAILAAYRATGATLYAPRNLFHVATAHAELGQLVEAWHSMTEAMTAIETTKERWCEPEAHRVAGQIALMPNDRNEAKAETCFERALAVARQQQAKSWELRAAMSLARLWRNQGKLQQARELLAPVYGWFTEGCDTLDLKEAKALLDEL